MTMLYLSNSLHQVRILHSQVQNFIYFDAGLQLLLQNVYVLTFSGQTNSTATEHNYRCHSYTNHNQSLQCYKRQMNNTKDTNNQLLS